MLALLGFAGGLVLLPLQNAFSRFMENEADRYAVGVIPSRTVFISMIQKLGARNLADAQPSAWMEFLFYDHPSIGRRIKNISRILTAVLFIFSFSGRVAAAEPDRIPGKVHWVVDGDTFQLETGERVRLIGVDTPEYQPWKNRIDPYGREASEYSKKLLSGKKVWLEKDAGEKDRYGRTLAYVYLEDGRFVNRILVEEGFARAKYYPPNGRYYEIFKTAQRAAKKLKKGLWAEKKAFKIVPS
ncbi:MAG: thermonuclease family protein [Candidatus Omnitrophica bacterium]|nr:thermonuclease family protein [Candidatus Omnitrophota bacterium]